MTERGKCIEEFLDSISDTICDVPEILPKWLVGCLALIAINDPAANDTLLNDIENESDLDGWVYVELLKLLNKLHNSESITAQPEPQPLPSPPPPAPPQQLSVRVTEHSVTRRITESKASGVIEDDDPRVVRGYLIEGKFFERQGAAAKHLGVSQSWFSQKICRREQTTIHGKVIKSVFEGEDVPVESGSPESESEPEPEKPASPDDIVQVGTTNRFPAMTAAAEALGVSPSTVKRAKKSGEPVGEENAILADAKDVKGWMCNQCGHSIPVDPYSRNPAIRCAKCRSGSWVAVGKVPEAAAS